MDSNLYLIGYRGAGKTMVARALARQLNRECFSIDVQIQESEGRSISEIFAEDGEAHFRDLESEWIGKVAKQSRLIVDLGGGAILRAGNRTRIRESGKCIWLQASKETLWRRIQGDQASKATRPSLTGLTGMAEVETVLREREPVYAECADFTIDTDELSPEEIALEIVSWLSKDDTQ